MKTSAILALTVLLCACSNPFSDDGSDSGSYKRPPKGTLIASDSMRADDGLNEFWFSVKLLAGEDDKKGTYVVISSFGPVGGEGGFTMPKNGEHLEPVLRRGEGTSNFVIGFRMSADDTIFYPYYGITRSRNALEMKYIKAYSIPE
jgi:hypothetical protein